MSINFAAGVLFNSEKDSENRVYAGPTLVWTDWMDNDESGSERSLKSETKLKWNAGT